MKLHLGRNVVLSHTNFFTTHVDLGGTVKLQVYDRHQRCLRVRERGPIRIGTDDRDDGMGRDRAEEGRKARPRPDGGSRSSHHFPFITRTISATLRTNTSSVSQKSRIFSSTMPFRMAYLSGPDFNTFLACKMQISHIWLQVLDVPWDT